jgi:hypothetical protein
MMNAVNNIAAALAATSSGKSEGGLIKATVAHGPSGEGVFTLRLSGGREIGVQVQSEGGVALEPGQKVLVSPSDGKIFIPTADAAAEQPAQSQQWAQAQQPAQMRQAAQMLLQQVQGGDWFISGKQEAEAVIDGEGDGGDGTKGAPATGQTGIAKIVGFKIVSEGEVHANGIYRADTAGHILEGPADGEAPIMGFAAVRLGTVNGQQVVSVLSGDGLQAAIEELRGSFESPLLRALPLELLKDIFNERGFLDTDTLKALDAALVNRSLSIDASSQFQMERIGQWLRIALDNPGMAQELVDRIPALGAKDAAGLLELIGRLSTGVAPESFFATGHTLPKVGASIGGADLLQSLVKAAFSAAPNALLNLVKQIDASSVLLGAQLPPTEAARVVREITSALPARAAVMPDSLHDAGQLSPRVLETNAANAPKAQTQAAVPQIRAGYSELTEAAVRALLGGGRADAAAVGERINALREAVTRISVTPTPSGQGHDIAAVRNNGVNGNRTDGNVASANAQSAVNRLSVPANATFVNATKVQEVFPHVNAQLAVHRASSVPSGDINTGAGGTGTKATDAFPAVNRGFVPQQPQQSPVRTGDVGTGIGMSGVTANSIDTGGSGAINNRIIGYVTGVNKSIPADNTRGMGINASGINPADNQNVRGDTGVNNRQAAVDNRRGVGTNSIDFTGNRNIREDTGIGINRSISADRSNGMGINTKSINPVDVLAIKESCLSIVDALKSSAAPVLRELAQRGQIGAGGAASLIGLVRDAVSSLDEILRPLVRSERPVPPEFYERVAANVRHHISAEAKNALFSQIGSAQALIRGAVEAAEGVGAGVNAGINLGVNSGINTNVGADVNHNIITTANVNPGINTGAGIDTNAYPSVNTGINPGHDTDTGGNHNINAGANANVNPAVNTDINPIAGTNVNSGININPNINTNVNHVVNPNVDIDVNTIDANANINPNANINTAANTDSRPDDFFRIVRRIWANTEKLRAGFREAFATLDLQNRASPLDKPVDDSTAGTVRRSADTLRTEMLLDVSRALRDVFSSVDELDENVSQLSIGSKVLPEAEAALLRSVRALEHQARQSGAEVMERLKDVLRELNRLQAEAARAQEQGTVAGAARSSPAEAIRSAALTAARSLENLQLLSTQTRTAETEQHLLAIPAKIGGEWTEVQIKFVKERKGEKGENKDGHVSIYLNVAPSVLGQVTAHLDYHPPNLNLAFRFEKPEVTRWFRQQSGELREALSQVGLPGTTLEFHTRRPVGNESAVSTLSSPNVDDGEAHKADEFEIKNGRVDFKI